MSATITRKITKTYRNANDYAIAQGTVWYDDTFTLCELLSWRYNVPLDNVIVAFSHLSPRVQYVMNVRAIKALVKGENKPSGMMSTTWNRAKNSLSAENPWSTFGKNAHKTLAFAKAIAGDSNAVVVDVWAARVAGLGHLSEKLDSKRNYELIASAYTRAAKRLNVSPRELQAITWVACRGRARVTSIPNYRVF